MQKVILCLLIVITSISFSAYSQESQIQDPSGYFQFKPGTDKKLFNYEELIAYLKVLDVASPMLKMVVYRFHLIGREYPEP